ncbi:VOC family protein [Acinetobacter colistiniresistens]|uniref:VOC family protein n=1 Tax=Acinetobacter colistiniresistens TaxID=280145 RepID=UPI000E5B8034|nr:VOC family protein [Acinetobacter colistiniresistens]
MNNKRANQLAVHSICEFVVSVPDLQQAYDFYHAFGLDVKKATDGYLELYTYGCAHRWARIYQAGDKKQLKWLSFGVYAEDFEAMQQHIAAKNIPTIAALDDQAAQSFWIQGPNELPLQIMVADKVSPSQKSKVIHPPKESWAGRAPNRKAIMQIRPDYLSHLAIFTVDVEATVNFYMDVLGLRMSDQSRGIVAFMHGAHGSDHHLLAVAKSNGSGLHHSSWNVDQVDDVGLGKQQMEQAGYDQGWGLGRHVLGSNYFYYVRDPWGSYTEYSHDIDFVSHDYDWPAADHPPEDSTFLWGPNPPQDFVMNYETI